jgi:hypothetical protein
VPGEFGDESGTMIQHATLVPKGDETYELGSNLGTMVINEDTEDNEEDTMKRKNLYYQQDQNTMAEIC